MMLYNCAKLRENISKDFSYSAGTIFLLQFSKGHNFIKHVGGVTETCSEHTSDNALLAYQVV